MCTWIKNRYITLSIKILGTVCIVLRDPPNDNRDKHRPIGTQGWAFFSQSQGSDELHSANRRRGMGHCYPMENRRQRILGVCDKMGNIRKGKVWWRIL